MGYCQSSNIIDRQPKEHDVSAHVKMVTIYLLEINFEADIPDFES